MGLCINFVIRLKSGASVAPFIKAAGAEARRRRWKARRRAAGSLRAMFSPHPDCQDVDLDFSAGLACDGFVKTSSAPQATHVAVVEFFDAIRPHAKSIKLDDETGYAEHRDPRKLAAAFAGFDDAMSAYSGRPRKAGGKLGRAAEAECEGPPPGPITFILGAMTIDADGKLVRRRGTKVIVRPEAEPKKQKR